MNNSVRLVLSLFVLAWFPPAWSGEAKNKIFEECIHETIFDQSVCTVQANRNANAGVILIHGLDGSTEDWRNIIPVLSSDFHVVAFDLPGFGKSDKGNQIYSPTRYAKLVQFLVNHYFKDKPYDVIGHSMGGAIALRFASTRPLQFNRLVLIDAAGILHAQVITKFQAGSMIEKASGFEQTRGFTERFSRKLLELAERMPISPEAIVHNAHGRGLVLQGDPSTIAALNLADEDFSEAIASVTAPTLIIWGDKDPVAPLRTGMVLATRMPKAYMEIVYDSGHVPMEDQPNKVNSLISKHLLASSPALDALFPLPRPTSAFDSQRKAICSGESNKIYEGDYKSIDLRQCSNIKIRNARIGHLAATDSRLTITDTDILGDQEGLHAEDSDITVTNGFISGNITINTARSRLDLAGVHLNGVKASVNAVDSKMVFSVSHLSSPLASGYFHTFKNINSEAF